MLFLTSDHSILMRNIFILGFIFLLFSCDSSESENTIPPEKEIEVVSVEITNKLTSLKKYEEVQLSFSINPKDASNTEVSWISSNTDVAEVSIDGKLTALTVGETTISAVSKMNDNISDSFELSVTGKTTNDMLEVRVGGLTAIMIDESTFGLQVPNDVDITALMPTINHNGEFISPAAGETVDFSDVVTYTVTSESGETKEWKVKIIKILDPPTGSGFITKWTTTHDGVSDINSIEIPTYLKPNINKVYTYNYTVDWGDGNVDENISDDIKHTYEIPGTYYVSITGDFPGIYFNQDPAIDTDNKKIEAIVQWGDIIWESFSFAFYDCRRLDVVATDTPNLTKVESVHGMFSLCTNLIGNSSFENWDVSNIAYASQMFQGCYLFNQDIGSWDVSNVKQFSLFFNVALEFNQDISKWDVSNARTMWSMFNGAEKFNQDIGNWYFPNVTDLGTMFQGAASFNQDISNWDVSNIEDFGYMFNGASNFNQPIGKWDMSGAKDVSGMFQAANSFTNDITNWDMSNVTNMAVMFGYNIAFNQDISNWDVGNVENMGGMFWNNRVFNQDLSSWNTSKVNTMFRMFEGATSFDQELSDWNISSVTDMGRMFLGTGLSTPNYDTTLIGWSGKESLQSNVNFDGGTSKYCNSETERQSLIDNLGWIITDGGKDCN